MIESRIIMMRLEGLVLSNTRALLKDMFGEQATKIESDIKLFKLDTLGYYKLLRAQLPEPLVLKVIATTMFVDLDFSGDLSEDIILSVYHDGTNYTIYYTVDVKDGSYDYSMNFTTKYVDGFINPYVDITEDSYFCKETDDISTYIEIPELVDVEICKFDSILRDKIRKSKASI